jgi:putative lipoprotein
MLHERPLIASLVLLALTAAMAANGDDADAQAIQGTATYRERMALPPGAVFEATIEDVSRADAPARVVAATRIAAPENPPIAFSIDYDPAKIATDHRYIVRAKILDGPTLLFSSDGATLVITRGAPTRVSMMLRRVAGRTAPATPGSPAAPSPSAGRALEATYWKAIEIAGKLLPAQDGTRDAHLVFHAGGRMSGSDGCNRIAGSYELRDDGIAFGQTMGTQMACPGTGEIEQGFRAALKDANRWRIVGDRLELLDASGGRLAAFEGRAGTP